MIQPLEIVFIVLMNLASIGVIIYTLHLRKITRSNELMIQVKLSDKTIELEKQITDLKNEVERFRTGK